MWVRLPPRAPTFFFVFERLRCDAPNFLALLQFQRLLGCAQFCAHLRCCEHAVDCVGLRTDVQRETTGATFVIARALMARRVVLTKRSPKCRKEIEVESMQSRFAPFRNMAHDSSLDPVRCKDSPPRLCLREQSSC
jgi:hypothetical protein